MPGVLLQLSYDGTGFHGWAAQASGRTVEDTVRGAIVALDPRAGPLRGASRTDAGVHATGQLAAFDTAADIPPRGWALGLNQHLPADVAVRAVWPVPVQFSPRFTALRKRYRYRVLVDLLRDPQWSTRAWRLPRLNIDAMQAEASAALGTHDFAAFRAAGDERPTTVRTLTRVEVTSEADGRLISIVVEGNAFLYNMVRILVGTLADVGRGRRPPGAVQEALARRERRAAGMTAPAHGLTLEHVDVQWPEGTGQPWPP